MKSKIPLSAEINMSTIHDGLSNTNQIISTLNRTKNLPNIPYETSKLVDIMVNTATFQVKMARDILERYQMTDNMDLLTPPPIPPPHSRSLMSVSGRVSHGDKKMQIMHRP